MKNGLFGQGDIDFFSHEASMKSENGKRSEVEKELERKNRGDMEPGDAEAREGLLPFARALQAVCMAPKHEKLRRHSTYSYRVGRLDGSLLKRYVPVKNMPTAELIMFPGFLTATKSGEVVWRQLDTFNGNCVFIIAPSYGQFPVDISRASDSPEDEEVIFPVGQAFRVMANTEVARVDLSEYIEAEMPPRGDPEEIVTVVEVEAADPFYTVARYTDISDILTRTSHKFLALHDLALKFWVLIFKKIVMLRAF